MNIMLPKSKIYVFKKKKKFQNCLIIWYEESVSLGKGPPPLKNNITHDSRLLFYDLTLFFSQADFIKYYYSFKQFPLCVCVTNKRVRTACAYWIITSPIYINVTIIMPFYRCNIGKRQGRGFMTDSDQK